MSARLRPMVGSAGATMVCSSALRNIASMMPMMIVRTVAGSTGAVAGPCSALSLNALMKSC